MATGTAERFAALEMLQEIPGSERVTVAGDKGFDTADFVRECRNIWVTPHVAQNLGRRGGSAIDRQLCLLLLPLPISSGRENTLGWLYLIAGAAVSDQNLNEARVFAQACKIGSNSGE